MKTAVFVVIIYLLLVPGLHAQYDSTLYPVRLSSFEAGISGGNAKLKWKTICYLSFARFQIQKSRDGSNFTTIKTFVADRLRCQEPFELFDSTRSIPGSVFYRINVGNIDGNFNYSQIVKVFNKHNGSVLSVYPTVVTSKANVVITSSFEETIQLKLVGISGIVVKQYLYKVPKGVSNISFDLNNVSKGQYWISYVDAEKTQHTIAVIKQ